MQVEITTLDDIDDCMFVSLAGIWNTDDTADVADQIQARKPTYLVVDPTECILTADITTPIDDASPQRQTLVNRIATLMQENPQMLYIIVNSNQNQLLTTSVSLYEKIGIADRYIFVKNRDEAIATIRQYQSKQ